MAENYDLIFGQSASQQYAWSDSDYQNGWQTVGSTPPTAEQFDALQRRSDTKAQDLNNRLEPIESKSEADGRQAATSYTAGAMVTVDGLPNGWLLQCIVPGISGTDAITLPDILIDGLTIIDGDVTWALRKVATNGGIGYRQPSTAYTAGQIAYHSALPTGYYLECTTAGTTSAGEITPSSTIGGTVTDGTVTWTVVGKNFNNRGTVGADFDNAIATGIYKYGGSAANNPISTGTDANGRLLTFHDVISGVDSILQNAVTLRGIMFTRVYFNGWTNWYQQEAIVAKSLGANGYIKYASGLIIQWGLKTAETNNFVISYPISFTHDGILVGGTSNKTDAIYRNGTPHAYEIGLSTTNVSASSKLYYQWIAIGY